MKTLRLLIVLALCHNFSAFGQTTEWAKQFGGNLEAQNNSVVTDVNGDVIITGYFRGTTDFNTGAGVFNLSSNSASDDIFITKLDSDGNLIWAKAIGSAADDRGNSVTTDNLGNIYVTGIFRNTTDFDPGAGVFNLTSNGTEDAFVLKLDTDGNFLWANQIGNASSDIGIAIAVDSNNQVWVTGSFFNSVTLDAFTLTSTGLEDIFVCKYNSGGSLLWAGRFGGTQRDVPGSIAVDSEQKVIVTGTFRVTMPVGSTSLISAGNNDIFIFKLNTTGVPEWARRAGGNGQDIGLGVATFGTDIIIAGQHQTTANFGPIATSWSAVSNGSSDGLLLKLNSSGTLIWGYGFGGAGIDAANAVAYNSNGDIHVTGTFTQTVDFYHGTPQYKLTSAGLTDTYIQKLNLNGEFIWTKVLNNLSNINGLSISTDAAGNVYTTGNFLSDFSVESGFESIELTAIGQQDAFIHKMSNCSENSITNLDIESCLSYNSPSGDYEYLESGIYLDVLISNSGCDSLLLINLEVPETPVVNTDIFACVSYTSPSGNETWTATGTYQDFVPSTSGCDTLYNIDLYIKQPSDCNDKSLEWYNQLGANTGDERGKGIVIDSQGYSYVCGYFSGTFSFELQNGIQSITSIGEDDIFIAKLRPNGTLLWVKHIGGTGDDQANSIAIDSNNNLYITGSYESTVDFDPGPGQFNLTNGGSTGGRTFVLKIDEYGQFLWAKQLTGSGSTAVGYGITIDVFGDVLVGGSFRGTIDFNPGAGVNEHTSAGLLDIFITKLDQGGNYIWSVTRGAGSNDECLGITTDQNGNILTTGYISGTVNFNPPDAGSTLSAKIFVYKMNAMGEFIWVKGVGSNSSDRGVGIATDSNGAVLIGGIFQNTVDFDPGIGVHNITNFYTGNEKWVFVLKLNSEGNFEWASSISSNDIFLYNSIPIITDHSNNVYVGGRHSQSGVGVRIYNSLGTIIADSDLDGGGQYSYLTGLAIDINRNVYCVGYFFTTLYISQQPTFTITSTGGDDVFVVKISECNNSTYTVNAVETCNTFTPPNAPSSVEWTSSGVYSYEVPNSAGCTDYNIYDLTINHGPTNTYNVTSCLGYTYPGANETWYESGTHVQYMPNPLGCDSALTLNLEITGTIYNQDHFECNSFTLPGDNTYYNSGTYEEIFPSDFGCDTLIRHHVILHNSAPESCDSYETNWVAQQGNEINYGEAYAVAADNFGNVYTTGVFRGMIDFDPGDDVFHLNQASINHDVVFISKMNAWGNLVWAKKFSGSASGQLMSGRAITVDSDFNVYIAGHFRGTVNFNTSGGTTNLTSAGQTDVFVCKLKSNGNLVWAKRFGNSSNISVNSIALDGQNRVLICGEYSGTVCFNTPGNGGCITSSNVSSDIYIHRLNNDGSFSTIRSFGGNNSNEECFGIATDASDNIITTGSFSGTVNFNPLTGTAINMTATGLYNKDIFVSKISSNGTLLWAYHAGSTQHDIGRSVTLDSQGNIYVTGSFTGTASFSTSPAGTITSLGNTDIFVLKLSSSGVFQWVKSMVGTQENFGNDIALDASNNPFITGKFLGTVDFDPGVEEHMLTSQVFASGHSDFFVAGLSSQGDFRFAKSFDGSFDKKGNSIACDNSNNLFVAGSFTGAVNFNTSVDEYILTAPAAIQSRDIFTLKMKPCAFEFSTEMSVTVCDSLQSPSGNYVWYESGTYSELLTSFAGCDSLVTIHLTVNGSVTEFNEQTCATYLWPVNGNTYNASGVYSVAYQNQLGCDSTLVLNLTINTDGYSETDVLGCDSYTSPSQQYIWTESGTYMDTISTVAGCDSIMTIHLTISNDSESFLEASACDLFVSPSGNLTLSTSGIYTDLIPNAAGCDSTITIDLTILESDSFTQTLTSCSSYFWDVNGLTYSNSGTYTASFTNIAGCDSTYVLNLTIPNINTIVNQNGFTLSAALSGASYQWIDCNNNTPIEGATSQFYTATANGSYAVQITLLGCPALSNCINITTINVENHSFVQQISVYPNPTAGNVFINVADLNESLSVRMINVVGQIISSGEYNNSTNIEYQMPETSGVYFLELMTESGNHALVKIVKL